MIYDSSAREESQYESSVVIIGGGTAGLVLANILIGKGVDALVLESGGREYSESLEKDLNTVEFVRSTYSGAINGRYRCAGGTSTRWGGALIPFQKTDFKGSQWEKLHKELNQFIPSLENLFSLVDGAYEDRNALVPETDYVTRLAKWPSFKRRNVFRLFEKLLSESAIARMFIDCTVTDFAFHGKRLDSVTATSREGQKIKVKGKVFILASGAIETTRLVLLMSRAHDSVALYNNEALGSGFSDHLSVHVADIVVKDRTRFNRTFGYQFTRKGGMRNLRFEMSENSVLRARFRPHFFHISFKEDHATGFTYLRDILRSLQQGNRPTSASILRLLTSLSWLIRALYWRFALKRLLYPDAAQIQLYLVLEQEDLKENRIYLSANQVDVLGVPVPVIDWAPSLGDQRGVLEIFAHFLSFWRESNLREFGHLLPRSQEEILNDLDKSTGIFHPTGSTRMGDTVEGAVVDRNLKVFGTENVWLLSTSVLPAGGGANPTMTLLLLAYRLADHLYPDS